MKDYSLNQEEKSKFILNYKADNNKIHINFANGDKVIIPYTKENEEKILDVMERQVRLSDTKLRNVKNEFLSAAVFGVLGLLLSLVILLGSTLGVLTISGKYFFLFNLSLGLMLVDGTLLVQTKKEINDIKKNKYFLEHERTLNDRVKDNENMLYKTHNVTKKQVKNTKEDEVVFTINSVDNIPFSDLEQIMANIQREDTFEFDYPKEEKSKKKTN